MPGVTLRRPGIPVGPGAWDRAYLWVSALGHTLGPVLMHGHTYVECILYLHVASCMQTYYSVSQIGSHVVVRFLSDFQASRQRVSLSFDSDRIYCLGCLLS